MKKSDIQAMRRATCMPPIAVIIAIVAMTLTCACKRDRSATLGIQTLSQAEQTIARRAHKKAIKIKRTLKLSGPTIANDKIIFERISLRDAKTKNACHRDQTPKTITLPFDASAISMFHEIAYCLDWRKRVSHGIEIGIRYADIGHMQGKTFIKDLNAWKHSLSAIENAVLAYDSKNIATPRRYYISNRLQKPRREKWAGVGIPQGLEKEVIGHYIAISEANLIIDLIPPAPRDRSNHPIRDYDSQLKRYAQQLMTGLITAKKALLMMNQTTPNYRQQTMFTLTLAKNDYQTRIFRSKPDTTYIKFPFDADPEILTLIMQQRIHEPGFTLRYNIKQSSSQSAADHHNFVKNAYKIAADNIRQAVKQYQKMQGLYPKRYRQRDSVYVISPDYFMPRSYMKKLGETRLLHFDIPYKLDADAIARLGLLRMADFKVTYRTGNKEGASRPLITRNQYLAGLHALSRSIPTLTDELLTFARTITFVISDPRSPTTTNHKHDTVSIYERVKTDHGTIDQDVLSVTNTTRLSLPYVSSSLQIKMLLSLYHKGIIIVGGERASEFYRAVTTLNEVVQTLLRDDHARKKFRSKYAIFRVGKKRGQLGLDDKKVFHIPFGANALTVINLLKREF